MPLRVRTLQYTEESGWSEGFPEVDPSRSLGLCFGAARYLSDSDPIVDLAIAIGGPIVGCSTSGEIHGGQVADSTLSIAVAVLQVLSADVTQVGFYSYGEISPSAEGGGHFDNQTMTLTLIGEAM